MSEILEQITKQYIQPQQITRNLQLSNKYIYISNYCHKNIEYMCNKVTEITCRLWNVSRDQLLGPVFSGSSLEKFHL
jgi:hypothetical protein